MQVKVIGIDPGLSATGVGIVSGSRTRVNQYAYGVIKTVQSATQACRLDMIFSRLKKLLAEEKPDLVVIEDVFSLEKYPQSGITLGKVCGAILLATQSACLPVEEIAVREAKQVLTGNGNAPKEQLERAVRDFLGCLEPIRPYHAADALGLALIGLFRYSKLGDNP